ncbi:UNVERIFIED_CONTAM: hypothetical protein K2H54_038340 [Gekko kuhli]
MKLPYTEEEEPPYLQFPLRENRSLWEKEGIDLLEIAERCHITTVQTQQILVKDWDPQQRYRMISWKLDDMLPRSEKVKEEHAFMGWKMPRSYLDLNRWNCHFNPQEFQHLVNNYSFILKTCIHRDYIIAYFYCKLGPDYYSKQHLFQEWAMSRHS